MEEKLLISIPDFKSLIKEGSYYVDKSRSIKEMAESSSLVLHFSRPLWLRNTLNLSMLRYFLARITAIAVVALLCTGNFALAGEDIILKDIFIGRYSVPGTACPFFSDVKDIYLFKDNYKTNRPIEILIPEGVNRIMLNVIGETGNCKRCNDSEIITTLDNYTQKGISPLTAPINSLVGVFLNDSPPNTEKMPHVLQNAGKKPNAVPLLQQMFFIYHPMTSACHVISVDLPEGATRLYLGVLDVYKWGDNTGNYSVAVRGMQIHSDVEPEKLSLLPKIILRPSVEIYNEPDEQSSVIYKNSNSFQVYPMHFRQDITSDSSAVEEGRIPKK